MGLAGVENEGEKYRSKRREEKKKENQDGSTRFNAEKVVQVRCPLCRRLRALQRLKERGRCTAKRPGPSSSLSLNLSLSLFTVSIEKRENSLEDQARQARRSLFRDMTFALFLPMLLADRKAPQSTPSVSSSLIKKKEEEESKKCYFFWLYAYSIDLKTRKKFTSNKPPLKKRKKILDFPIE